MYTREWIEKQGADLQVNDVGMIELSHDGRLGEEVGARLFRRARLERLDGDVRLRLIGEAERALADVAEFARANDVVDANGRCV